MTSTMGTSPAKEEDEASSASTAPASALSIFHEDIMLAILGFVADVPFEIAESTRVSHSTLTHTLPLVSKQFHRLAGRHDLYWKQGLLRLLRKEPSLWEEGMKRVTFDADCDALRDELLERQRGRATRRRGKRTKYPAHEPPPPPQSAEPNAAPPAAPPAEQSDAPAFAREDALLQRACAALLARRGPPASAGAHQRVFRAIVARHLRYQAPVFCMPSTMRLGSPYGLHFFEQRYRLLIADVMAPYPAGARRGEHIAPLVPGLLPPPPRAHGRRGPDDDLRAATLDLLERNEALLHAHHLPTFIHAHQSLSERTPATLVQIVQCHVQADGSADVFLRPVAYLWLEELWERPGTGGLVEARGVRMGRKAGAQYEQWCGMRSYGSGDGRGRGQMLPLP